MLCPLRMGPSIVGSATILSVRWGKTISGDTLNQSTFQTSFRISVLNATSLWAQDWHYRSIGRSATQNIRCDTSVWHIFYIYYWITNKYEVYITNMKAFLWFSFSVMIQASSPDHKTWISTFWLLKTAPTSVEFAVNPWEKIISRGTLSPSIFQTPFPMNALSALMWLAQRRH